LVAGLVVLAACGHTPDVTIDGKRNDTTTALNIELCPEGNMFGTVLCTPPVNLFEGVSDTERNADVFIRDQSTTLTAFLQTPNVTCVQVAITLFGTVTVDFTAGSNTAHCDPSTSCIPVELSSAACM
jgi:hypothetical protein